MLEPSRAIVVLHTACTTLHFDGAELWRLSSSSSSFSPVSLDLIGHYAPNDRVSLPIFPSNGLDLSSMICRTTCDKTGQIVWVTSKQHEGLLGSGTSSSLPVMTACGMPICTVQGSMFIMILFGVEKQFMNPHSLELLCSIARVASDGTSLGFCPPNRVVPTDFIKFASMWSLKDRMNADHTSMLEFQVMEIDRLQAFLDYAEMAAFHELLLEDENSDHRCPDVVVPEKMSPLMLQKGEIVEREPAFCSVLMGNEGKCPRRMIDSDNLDKTLTSMNLSKLPTTNNPLSINTLRRVASSSTTSDEYNINGDVFSGTGTTTCVSCPGSPYSLEERPSKCSKMESSTVPPSECGDSKGRRCQFDDCNKYAQGSTCYCIKHGGGRRCTVPLCLKGARDKLYCALHGGGKRCEVLSCFKSAVGGSTMCTAHGGGKRCRFTNCGRSAQSSTFFCVKHGGGRKCSKEACEKVARGRTNFCAGHGRKLRGDTTLAMPYCTETKRKEV